MICDGDLPATKMPSSLCSSITGGEILQRVASDGADGHPHEVQLYRFPDQGALQGFLDDPRRQKLSPERDRVIERTELFPVHTQTQVGTIPR